MAFPSLHLLRWLGPWADQGAAPPGVSRRETHIDGTGSEPLRVWIYSPERGAIRGSLLFLHGINPWGPEDHRADRFLRVLAKAGFLVVAPFLPDFLAIDLNPRASEDVKRVLAMFPSLDEHPRESRPALFSVSFGSMPALQVASDPSTAGLLSGAVLFGGFGDPRATVSFALGLDGSTKERRAGPDRLVFPALAMFLTDSRSTQASQAARAARPLWLRYIQATWGIAEMKDAEKHAALARSLALEVGGEVRDVFLAGCGVDRDHVGFFEELVRRRGSHAELDVRDRLSGVECPLRLIHGIQDPVIPHTELDTLRAALPGSADVRSYRTGLFAHSHVRSIREVAGLGPLLVREVWTILGMVSSVVTMGKRR